ncbi:hypothetical protein CRYUN_Cryun33cG0011700 [Craigia yunnanensis]
MEKPKMEALGTWNLQPVVLTLNCLFTFAPNLSVFLVISHTSALTIHVAGVVKDWVVVLLSALLFADAKLTVINLFGYGIGTMAPSGMMELIQGFAGLAMNIYASDMPKYCVTRWRPRRPRCFLGRSRCFPGRLAPGLVCTT